MTARRRLKNNKGFSLAEMLLAILILLLVSTIVATGVPAARNAYYKVILGSNAQSLLSTTVTALRDELGTAWGDILAEDKTITYFKADSGCVAKLDLSQYPFEVTEYVTAETLMIDNKEGISHKLLPAKAATDAMEITCEGGISFDGGVVTITDLQVQKDEETLATLGSLAIRVFSANTESIAKSISADD